MANRKSHHYVPQFYLRNFASLQDKKRIGLYNYKAKIYITAAPIKHQACQKFLYGIDDEIEDGLSKLEYYTSLTIQKLFEIQIPPPENSIYFEVLKKFILSQLSRTIKAGNDVNNLLSTGLKEVFKASSIYKPEYEDIVFRHQQPALLSLIHSEFGLPLMNYLSCKLIINRTATPFITSDNPVAKYNQFFENKKLVYGTTAIAVKGLQIFLPIHPTMMLVLYDPIVYKLGDRHDKTISILDKNDIFQLNALQFINSESQLFFGENVTKEYVEIIIRRYESIKQKRGLISKTFESEEYDSRGAKKKYLINTGKEPQMNLSLSFIKLTKASKQFELNNKIVYYRHPSFEDFRKKKNDQLFNDLKYV